MGHQAALRRGRVNLKVVCACPRHRKLCHWAQWGWKGTKELILPSEDLKMSIQEPVCPSDGLTASCAQVTCKTSRGFSIALTLGIAPPVRAPAPGRSQQAAKGSDVNKTTQPLPSRAGNTSKPLQYPPGMTSGHSYASPCCIRSWDVGHEGTVFLHKPAQPHSSPIPEGINYSLLRPQNERHCLSSTGKALENL